MILTSVLLYCVLVFCEAAFEGEKCAVDGVEGICTLIPKCKSAIEGLNNGKDPQQCGYENTIPIVCCVTNPVTTPTHRPPLLTTPKITTTTMYRPKEPIYMDFDRSGGCEDILPSMTSVKTGQKAFDKCIEYQEKYVYPCERSVAFTEELIRGTECYHDVDALIGGGSDTEEHEFPHMVLLGFGQIDDVMWRCGGSIISENYILTAGHCISIRNVTVQYILVGAQRRRDADDNSKIYKVKRTIMHPDYRPPRKDNDIMLVETEKKMPLSQHIVPACLHVGDSIVDLNVIATGWGQLGPHGSISEVMQKVTLQKFTTEECQYSFADDIHLENGVDKESKICYGHRKEQKDTCTGDSGGPVQIYSKKIHCMYTVVGVTSSGWKCGLVNEPAIYTRVAHYVPWIESIVWP